MGGSGKAEALTAPTAQSSGRPIGIASSALSRQDMSDQESVVTGRAVDPAAVLHDGPQSSSVRFTPCTKTTSGPSPPWSRTERSIPS